MKYHLLKHRPQNDIVIGKTKHRCQMMMSFALS